jgi:hypothetical protein
MMERKDEVESSRKPNVTTVLISLIVLILVVLSGFALVTIAANSQIPSSDFVTKPTAQLSTAGDSVSFVSVSDVSQSGLAVGVQGYLMTTSGVPVTGAKVYITYYLRGAYRSQAAVTDQNGHFDARFPMNWTGWLPVTLTYLGDDQHKGLTQAFSVAGEST